MGEENNAQIMIIVQADNNTPGGQSSAYPEKI